MKNFKVLVNGIDRGAKLFNVIFQAHLEEMDFPLFADSARNGKLVADLCAPENEALRKMYLPSELEIIFSESF